MKEKTDNIDILEEPKDILFKIDMQLYDEFNDKFCEIEENLGTVYSYKDLEDLKKAESDTERTLLREAISTLIAENKELKETIKNNIILVKDENGNYEELNINITDYIPKSKVEELIEEVKEDENPSISSFQEYAQEYAIDKLQSLLGKE